MANATPIEWTNWNWNPFVGCTKVSEGCRNCYAMRMASRIANAAQRALRDGKPLTDVQEAYRKVVMWKRGGKTPADNHDVAVAKWNNEIAVIESVLMLPLRWKTRRIIFADSMSDLFHEKVTDADLDRVYAIMSLCPHLTFQILTKRPERAARYLNDPMTWVRVNAVLWSMCKPVLKGAGPVKLPNVWLGTSCEDQPAADARILWLLQCPAAIHFLSLEPLIGPIDLTRVAQASKGLSTRWIDALAGDAWVSGPNGTEIYAGVPHGAIDWVIVGGESGPGARAMHLDWARSLRDQCVAGRVRFFFKQFGAWLPGEAEREGDQILRVAYQHGRTYEGDPGANSRIHVEGDFVYLHLSKHDSGRLLDGRTWDEMPEAVNV
jgi:protein gp37